MGVLFKSWGLDGSLAVDSFSSLHSDGLVGSPISVHGVGANGNHHAARVDLDGGQAICMRVLQTDAIAASGHRTELVPATANYSGVTDYVGIADWGGAFSTQERWYRVQFKIPEFDTSFLENSATWMVVAQLHQDPDTTPADTVANPLIAWHVTGSTIQVMNVASSAQVTNNSNKVTRLLYEAPLVFNTWYDFVINVKWSWTTLGKVSIWHDLRKVYSETGVMNCANNTVARGSDGNYAKFGAYTKHPLSDYTGQDLIVYHRGMIVGDESTVFADMYPERPGATELPPWLLYSGLLPGLS